MIFALVALLASGLIASCGVEGESVAAEISKASETTRGLGIRMSMRGTVGADGESMPIRSRASIEPSGLRARIKTEVGSTTFEQYLDDGFMLMSVDSLPPDDSLPPGTRFVKFDLDAVSKSLGIDTGLREMMRMDPAQAAAMFTDAADVEKLGRGRVLGVAVTRYRSTVSIEDAVKALDKDGDSPKLPKLLRDSEMTVEVAIDDKKQIRGFDIKGKIGPMTMDLKAVVTSFSRDLRVDVPSEGVHDITDDVVDLLGELPR